MQPRFRKKPFYVKLTTFSTAKETKSETKPVIESESKSKKKKGEVTLDSFPSFACISSYLRFNNCTWKRDCAISSKLQMLRG